MSKKHDSSLGRKHFHLRVQKAIKHNEKSQNRRAVKITYKKLNGRTVKRKVEPLTMKGNVLVAFDHKRKALRSFKMERVKHMEKAAFWEGFAKQADGSATGGSGHTGTGKGSISGQLLWDEVSGPESAFPGGSPEDNLKTDKTLLDRERNPRDYGFGESGPEFQDGANPHVRY